MSGNSMDLDSGEGPSTRPAAPPVNQPAADEVSVPEELWVKIEGGFPTGISTEGCKIVDELRKAIKKELELSWSLTLFGLFVEGKPGNPLVPRMLLRDAVAKHGITSNTVLIAKKIPAEVDFPAFKPENYKIEFPFFAKNGEEYLNVIARNDVLKIINENVKDRANSQKYRPIVISTSRGMGKTFLLKVFGLQKVPDHLNCPEVLYAGRCGRILSFDFSTEASAITDEYDIDSFFQRLMMFYLCKTFDGSRVDGINFKFEPFSIISNVWRNHPHCPEGTSTLNDWFLKCHSFTVEMMIGEFIRLTNMAFRVNYDFPPVFLLDEVGELASIGTKIVSAPDGSRHTRLSYLLSRLAKHWNPLCICTGTNDGRILRITSMSSFMPLVLSLSPFTEEEDFWNYWDQMTAFRNGQRGSDSVVIKHDNLSLSLIYSSYQIPRLLYYAHSTLYENLWEGKKNRHYIMEEFEKKAKAYYAEMFGLLENADFSEADIAHIILTCGTHWTVNDPSAKIPGTQIQFNTLIQKSIIFPFGNQTYVFPFNLIWNTQVSQTRSVLTKKERIVNFCRLIVPNLNVHDLHVEFDRLFSQDLYNTGLSFEKLFVSSLATKYYLYSLCNQVDVDGYITFSELYDVELSDEKTAQVLDGHCLNLSEGILLDRMEHFVDEEKLAKAIIHNCNIRTAHHDFILPSDKGLIPVSSKYSTTLRVNDIEAQRLTRKGSNKRVQLLIWLYLGNDNQEMLYDNSVIFMNGSGCCSSLSLDIFVLVKKIRSEMNRS
ncbi:hypothetical protein MP638_000601 [Amoeboaphelidium occidentale]|nr:hypothetical protein MP638_000601 [Amoeboaphelidium occidentale]